MPVAFSTVGESLLEEACQKTGDGPGARSRRRPRATIDPSLVEKFTALGNPMDAVAGAVGVCRATLYCHPAVLPGHCGSRGPRPAAGRIQVRRRLFVGFDDEELARLIAEQDAGAGLTDEDAVPDLAEIPVSAAGDLWILANHKLYVGDATSQTAVAGLMAGDAADLVFTDPPYNVDYEGYTDDKLKIRGDKMTPEEFQHEFRRVPVTRHHPPRPLISSWRRITSEIDIGS